MKTSPDFTERWGVCDVGTLVDAQGRAITQVTTTHTTTAFKVQAIVVNLREKYIREFKKKGQTRGVVRTTEVLAGLLTRLVRGDNFAKRYLSCGMDSTDYNNIKYIGERMELECVARIVKMDFPGLDMAEIANDEEIMRRYWGTNKTTIKRATSYLRMEPVSDSEAETVYEYSTDSESNSGDDDDEEENKEEEEEEENDSFVVDDDAGEDDEASWQKSHASSVGENDSKTEGDDCHSLVGEDNNGAGADTIDEDTSEQGNDMDKLDEDDYELIKEATKTGQKNDNDDRSTIQDTFEVHCSDASSDCD